MNSKETQTQVKKSILVAFFFISGVLFFIGIHEDSILLTLFGTPFFINVIVFIHEAGHAVGCKFNKSMITEIRIPLLTISEKTVRVNADIRQGCYCSFKKNNSNIVVYLFGPLFSLLFSLMISTLWISLGGNVFFVLMIVSFLHFAKSTIPIGSSDINMVIKEIRRCK